MKPRSLSEIAADMRDLSLGANATRITLEFAAADDLRAFIRALYSAHLNTAAGTAKVRCRVTGSVVQRGGA